jgi:hypothetical protein
LFAAVSRHFRRKIAGKFAGKTTDSSFLDRYWVSAWTLQLILLFLFSWRVCFGQKKEEGDIGEDKDFCFLLEDKRPVGAGNIT